MGKLNKAKHDPRTAKYWSGESETQWSARLTHRIKTLYGLLRLLRLIEDAVTRKKAEQGFLYLMA